MSKRVAVDNVEPDPEIAGNEVESKNVFEPVEKAVTSIKKAVVTENVKSKAGKSVLSSFLVCPPRISFRNQRTEEQVVLLLRAHLVTNVPWVIGAFLLLLVPFIVLPILTFSGALPISAGMTTILTLIWISGVFSFSFLKFLYWYFNVYIVTTDQIVDVDWYNIVYKAVSAALLENVQDVTSKQGGVIAGIFDYGNVFVQTAGTESNFEFDNVPHPQAVAEEIQVLMSSEGVGKIAVDSVGGSIR